jgi:hypothetical protein
MCADLRREKDARDESAPGATRNAFGETSVKEFGSAPTFRREEEREEERQGVPRAVRECTAHPLGIPLGEAGNAYEQMRLRRAASFVDGRADPRPRFFIFG